MRIILLSAGKGTRMWPLTRNTPKCLLSVSDSHTVLQHQLKTIRNVETPFKVTVVLGYLVEKVEAALEEYDRGMDIEVVYNPFYDVSNNLASLWMAHYLMDEPFIIINGDDIFRRSVLQALSDSPHAASMVISCNPDGYDDDDMKVIVGEDGLVKQVGKGLDKEAANGESIGMTKFQDGAHRLLAAKLNEMMRTDEGKTVFYLEAIQRLINEGTALHPIEVSQENWAEIDFHLDLNIIHSRIHMFDVS